MRKTTLFITFALTILACKNNRETQNPKEEIQITESLKEDESENKTISSSENQSEEIRNIKVQMNEYLSAFINGNSDLALTYCYPDLFAFMDNQYSELNTIEEAKAIFKENIDALKEMAVNGVKYEFEVGDIKEVVNDENLKIYSVVTYLKVEKGLDSNTSGGEQFAISKDNGKTWKFLEKDANKNYIKVLSLNIPNRIVSRIE